MNASSKEIAKLNTQDSIATAIAFNGRILGDKNSTRLLVDFDRKVKPHVFYMNNPLRIVVDMGKTAFRFQNKKQVRARGLIREFRYGAMAQGQSRIVITLRGPAQAKPVTIAALKGGKFRLTLDMDKISTAEFTKLIESQASQVGTSGDLVIKGDRLQKIGKKSDRPMIVLDPGHGGIDGGARGVSGSREKNITLAIALVIEKEIRKNGKFDVVLTRRRDHFISLKARVQFAMRHQADLFISIHADILNQPDIRGATVYTLSRKASDELSKKLAESANRSDLIGGLAVEKVNDRVVDILADLAARETKKFSLRFARGVVDGFRGKINLINNPHRYAAFGVLKDPNVPSILLETGYISNKEDEKLLLSDTWRAKLARNLVQAIESFFANR